MKYLSNITFSLLLVAAAVTFQNCGSSKAKEEEETAEKPVEALVIEGFVLKKGSCLPTYRFLANSLRFSRLIFMPK
ncbi:hypothetical protein [Dyadobacter sp. NIV53]|uniref:hypothetical protein n=1 Tax=Dyadobacter sp. NIV53 TaxID=2861765 RepID=UPI001E58D6C6|nr:hypothetical protein [Dyadobacter sp. NIV53]